MLEQRPAITIKVSQHQKIILTPELRQAIGILQMPAAELAMYVRQQLEENPLLDEENPQLDLEGEDHPAQTDALVDWMIRARPGTGSPRSQEDDPWSPEPAAPVTFREHLLWQLAMSPTGESGAAIGRMIIDSLDERGYLCASVAELAAMNRCSEAEVAEVLSLVQSFDPSGVAARDLRECLIIQLDHLCADAGRTGSLPEAEKDFDLARAIVSEHLEEVGRGRIKGLARTLAVSPEQIQSAVDLIRRLEPKPARNFEGAGQNNYVYPDLVVKRVDGDLVVLVNESTIPSIGLNLYYRRMLQRSAEGLSAEARDYLDQKLRAALWLLKGIEKRHDTMRKIMQAIIDLQPGFFAEEPGGAALPRLVPMTLREVAHRADVHESTVSRATANKFVQTSRGLFELKSFFSGGYRREDGEDVSALMVKDKIESLVAQEDPRNPLSDSNLVRELARAGICVSRRTMAKYRQELGIPSSRQRRRY